MPIEKATKAVSLFQDIVQIGTLLMLGGVMVFYVGWPLVSGGIGSGYVPLIIGLCAFVGAGRTLWRMRP